MESFISLTAKSIVEKLGWQQLQNTTIVFPSRRAGIVMKNELMKLMGERQVAYAPEVTTLADLFADISPLQKEEELFLVCRLYKIYREQTHDNMGLDRFYGWGRQLIVDFSNVQRCVGPEQQKNFFDNAAAAQILDTPLMDDQVRRHLIELLIGRHRVVREGGKEEQFQLLWQNLYQIFIRFTEELEAEHRGTDGMVARSAVETLKQPDNKLFARNVVFVGFNYLLPVEKQLMDWFAERDTNASTQANYLAERDTNALTQANNKPGMTLFYWDYVEDFSTNTKAFSYVKQYVQHFGNDAKPMQMDARKKVNVIATTSTEAQVQYVYTWLKNTYTTPAPTAIVICDETALEPVVYALPKLQLPNSETPENINITKGFPLKNTQLYTEVLARLEKLIRKKEYTINAIIEELYRYVLSQAEKNIENQQNNTWQQLLIQEAVYQTAIALRQFGQLLADPKVRDWVSEIDTKALRNLLRRHLDTISLPFHGEPISNIQVMGVLETRQMDFENLLLLNVEEGVLPQHNTDKSFIPYYLRKSYGLPTGDENADIYAYNFFRMISRASNITMLFSSGDSGLNKKAMSRFVMQMMTSPDFQVCKYALAENAQLHPANLIDLQDNKRNMLSLLDIKDGQLYRHDKQKDDATSPFSISPSAIKQKDDATSPFSISPSAINAFVQCPRQFYLKYIENISEPANPNAIFLPSELGSFVHHCMQHIYADLFGFSGSIPVEIDAQKLMQIKQDNDCLAQMLRKAYGSMNAEYRRNNHLDNQADDFYILDNHKMENMVIIENVKNILTFDIETAKNGLRICMLERTIYFDVPIQLNNIQCRVSVKGQIDRLDQVKIAGKWVTRVVDYKTGGYKDKKLIYSPDSIAIDPDAAYVRQTFIYSEAVYSLCQQDDFAYLLKDSHSIEPHLFFSQYTLSNENSMLSQNNLPIHDYLLLRDDFIAELKDLLQQLLSTTDFPEAPNGNCPSYCPFFLICGKEKPFRQ